MCRGAICRGAIYKPVHSIALVSALHFWHTTCYHFIAFQQVCLDALFFQPYNAVEALFKSIIMTNDDELIEATYAPNLLRKVHASQFIHVLCWLVKEGNIERREL